MRIVGVLFFFLYWLIVLSYSISNSAKAHNFTGSNLQEVFNAVKKAGELAGIGVESVILIVREL